MKSNNSTKSNIFLIVLIFVFLGCEKTSKNVIKLDSTKLNEIMNRYVDEGIYPFLFARIEGDHGVIYEHSVVNKKILGDISNIQLVVSGGVAANLHIREELKKLCLETDSTFFAPPLNLCTDNGAMIAWAGYEKFNNEGESNLNFKPRPRWPLDPNAHLINPIHQNIGKSGAKA